jgi:hypothetical protein
MAFARIGVDYDQLIAGYYRFSNKPREVDAYLGGLNKKVDEHNAEAVKKWGSEQAAKDNKDWLPQNTSCTIQMSAAFNNTKLKIPATSAYRSSMMFGPDSGAHSADQLARLQGYSIQAVSEMEWWLTQTFGPTDDLKVLAAKEKRDPQALIKGKKGVLVFGGVHVEFWDGDKIYQTGGMVMLPGDSKPQPFTGMSAGIWNQKSVKFWEIVPPGDAPDVTVPSWLSGWWKVWDGSTYYYYFQDTPFVVWTENPPSANEAPSSFKVKNEGKVTFTEAGFKINWRENKDARGQALKTIVDGAFKGTEESFPHKKDASDVKRMVGKSSRYSPPVADKLFT